MKIHGYYYYTNSTIIRCVYRWILDNSHIPTSAFASNINITTIVLYWMGNISFTWLVCEWCNKLASPQKSWYLELSGIYRSEKVVPFASNGRLEFTSIYITSTLLRGRRVDIQTTVSEDRVTCIWRVSVTI